MRTKNSAGRFVVNDLSGQKFGKLTVVSLHTERSKNRHTLWTCKCDCGNVKVVRGSHLLDGNYKSCGCIKIRPMSGFTTIVANYRCKARAAGRAFTLDDVSIMLITSSPCYYCGEPPNKIRTSTSGRHPYSWNGIDRVDSTQGYELWNCVPCCHKCNIAKRDMTTVEFYSWISKLSEHHLNQYAETNAIAEILSQCA